ncbi:MAG: hypothetical protein EOP05_14360, partial [Proteobacteria bacterium]
MLTSLLTGVDVGQALASQSVKRTCSEAFGIKISATAAAIELANDNLAKLALETLDEMSEEIATARMNRFAKVLAMSDAEFAALRTSPLNFGDTVSSAVTNGKSVTEAVESKFGRYDSPWRHRVADFDEAGNVRTDLLPRVSLSLENGRQKLDFARIHFSKRDAALADVILEDYLQLAEKQRGLRLLIVTDREDLGAKLRTVPSDVRNRIQIEHSKESLWIWAQDGSKPVDLPRTTAEFGQARYTKSTTELGERAVLDVIPVAVNGAQEHFLQGGDIIVGDRHVFVGLAEINYVRMAYHESEAGALRVLSAIFQKEAVPAYVRETGHGAEAWSFHIDLDMVVAVDRKTNHEVVLVRSPEELLNQLAETKLPVVLEDADVIAARNRIVERYTRGDFGKPLAKGSREFLERLSTISNLDLKWSIYRGRVFSRLISSYGYEVRPLPGFGNAAES